jgi:hypothetical protein
MFRVGQKLLSTNYSKIPYFNSCTTTAKKSASVGLGILAGSSGSYLFTRQKIAFAQSEPRDSLIHDAIDEILSHCIWETVGHVCKLSSFATGLLGNLLSCQSLGEKDVFYIQNISKPLIIKSINPETGKMEDALKLPNGKIIRGRDILGFCEGLQSAEILRNLQRGRSK